MRGIFFAKIILVLILVVSSAYFFTAFRQKSSSTGNGFEASFVLGQNNLQNGVTNNISATSISLLNPSDVEVDSLNNKLYVYDQGNHRVLVYNLNGNDTLVDSTADFVLGQESLDTFVNCGDLGVTSSNFCGGGLAIDPDTQTLFVTDSERNRILLFDVTSISNGESAFGVIGQVNFTDTTLAAPPTQSSVRSTNIDYDSENNRIFVSDYLDSRVLVMDYDKDTFVDGQNFDLVLGPNDFVTSGNCSVVDAFNLCYPTSVAFNSSSDQLFVTDNINNRVLIYDASVANLSIEDPAIKVLGQSDFTTNTVYGGLTSDSDKGFNGPINVDFDETSNLAFISDSDSKIFVFDIAVINDFESAINVIGQTSFSSQDCPGVISASITCVTSGLTVSSAGNILYAVDGTRSRVLGFDITSITNGEAANQLIGQANYTSDYDNYLTVPNSSGFDTPNDVEFDHVNNRLFTLDEGNGRIMVHNTNSQGIPNDNIADYVLGLPNMTTPFDSCLATASSFCSPNSIAIDTTNNRLFVSDTGANRILVFDIGSLSNGMGAEYVIGQIDFENLGSESTSTTLYLPLGIVYDSTNEYLYVSDSGNNRVLGYDLSEGISNGMAASRVIGQLNFTDNLSNRGGGMDVNTLSTPDGIAIDNTNNRLYVSDNSNGRVLVFDVSDDEFTNGLDADHVIGSSDFISSDYDYISDSRGIAVDMNSKLLYVADQNDSRIVIYDISIISNGEAPVSILGQADFNDTDCNHDNGSDYVRSYTICDALGLGLNNENGNLYLADTDNNRVLIYDFAKITQSSFASGQSGQSYNQSLTINNEQGDADISMFDGELPAGLSLNSNSITGTPISTGSYNFILEVTDDNGDNGIFRQLQEYRILVDPELIDTDGDGITDVIENDSPNSGDSNDDNILDSEQDNVTVMVNSITDNYVVLESNCISNDNVDVDSNTQDDAFTYPFGVLEFVINCTNPGDTANVKLIFFEEEDASQFVLRKFDGNDFNTVSDYSIVEGTLDGENMITVTYDIVDGGILDQDGVANGTIVDPVGLGQNSVDTPNTGLGGAFRSK